MDKVRATLMPPSDQQIRWSWSHLRHRERDGEGMICLNLGNQWPHYKEKNRLLSFSLLYILLEYS